MMIAKTRNERALLPMLVAAAVFFCAPQAGAQMPPGDQHAPPTVADAAPNATDDDLKDMEPDWSQLNVVAPELTPGVASKPRQAPRPQPGGDLSWSSSNKPNGASAVTVKQPVSSFWDARVGADMTVAREPATLTESQILSEKLANGGSLPQSSGTAWAAITAPGVGAIWDKTSVEARVDPAQERSNVGTSLSKSLALDDQYSLTLQSGANVIQQGIVPVPGIAARTERGYQAEQSAKVSITDSGTSLTAGQALSSANDKLLHTVGAEQKLFGGLTIRGSIGETSQGTTSKRVGFALNHSW